MNSATLTAELRRQAEALGFGLCGVCPAVTPSGVNRLHDWLAAGFAGEMSYLADRAAAYADPRQVLEGARSIVLLGLDYRTAAPKPVALGQGKVSRYAWGDDYHDLIRTRLHTLADFLRTAAPGCHARGVVDTAPLLEREFAQLAGLGWIGKNTLLINKRRGSWFFLAALLTDLDLEYDAPHEADHCGVCTACLDACPTQAFPAPGVLDARRCISYLTIELRSPIPVELRTGMGDWLFGCDVCQDVCPWNRHSPEASEPAFLPRAGQDPLELAELFALDEAAFRRRFRGSPLWRPKRRGLLRNAAIVLGNQRATAALPALLLGLADEEPLVRGACAWALGQIGGTAVDEGLRAAAGREDDSEVAAEIVAALRQSGASFR